ncbi:MAG: TadE/TadG family type IV pilus assembly protein [Pseudomonadota bacterium]
MSSRKSSSDDPGPREAEALNSRGIPAPRAAAHRAGRDDTSIKSIPAFLRSRSGLAAIEFAFIAPVMILLFFGVVEGSSAYSTNRKVLMSANTLADLVAQETSITKDSLDDLFVGMEDIIDQRDIDVTFRVVSVYLDTATGDVKVHWSRDSNDAVPYAAGSVFPGDIDAALLNDASSLILAETEYDYVSPISQKVIGAITMKKTATRWPRLSSKVQFCITVGSCTT